MEIVKAKKRLQNQQRKNQQKKEENFIMIFCPYCHEEMYIRKDDIID